MATAAIHCNSPSSIMATLELHAGRLTGNGLLSIPTQGAQSRSTWSILKVVIFTPLLPGTMKIAYLAGHATARQSTLPPTAPATGRCGATNFQPEKRRR